jgi:hypothetical protein
MNLQNFKAVVRKLQKLKANMCVLYDLLPNLTKIIQ